MAQTDSSDATETEADTDLVAVDLGSNGADEQGSQHALLGGSSRLI